MRAVISLLFFLSLCSGIAAIAGINHFSYSQSTGVKIDYSTTPERTAMAALFVSSAIAVFGCIKRRQFGWWLVAGGIAIMIGAAIVSAVMSLLATVAPATDRLTWVFTDLAVCGLLIYFFLKVWIPTRREFNGHPKA